MDKIKHLNAISDHFQNFTKYVIYLMCKSTAASWNHDL